MKKLVPLTLAVLACASFVTVPAEAAYYGFSNLNRTEAGLQTRINQGLRSGFLTRSEFSNLQSKLSRINTLEARLRHSGRGLNFRERARIQAELAQLNQQITFQLNDRQTQYNRRHIGYRRTFRR
jgi:hypothetical protein